jgi:hypothetical protein
MQPVQAIFEFLQVKSTAAIKVPLTLIGRGCLLPYGKTMKLVIWLVWWMAKQ